VSVTTQYSLRERNRFQEQRFLFGHGKDYGADIFKAAITLMANRGAHIGFGNALPARRVVDKFFAMQQQCRLRIADGRK
jgi:hypothetical protein